MQAYHLERQKLHNISWSLLLPISSPVDKFHVTPHNIIADPSRQPSAARPFYTNPTTMQPPSPAQPSPQSQAPVPSNYRFSEAAPLLRLSGLLSVYFANALANALLQLTFWLATKLSTTTAIARSMSALLQNSLRRILAKDSAMRIMASRWRTCENFVLASAARSYRKSNEVKYEGDKEQWKTTKRDVP